LRGCILGKVIILIGVTLGAATEITTKPLVLLLLKAFLIPTGIASELASIKLKSVLHRALIGST
ncbi:hypothetical protein, partial [Cesiribacter sp. SM1]|uniref:hypothetical protein n=1 Tax=Cesiribacter sp. SM1 TaxID=2861196 RepID=UPI001CD1BF02